MDGGTAADSRAGSCIVPQTWAAARAMASPVIDGLLPS